MGAAALVAHGGENSDRPQGEGMIGAAIGGDSRLEAELEEAGARGCEMGTLQCEWV